MNTTTTNPHMAAKNPETDNTTKHPHDGSRVRDRRRRSSTTLQQVMDATMERWLSPAEISRQADVRDVERVLELLRRLQDAGLVETEVVSAPEVSWHAGDNARRGVSEKAAAGWDVSAIAAATSFTRVEVLEILENPPPPAPEPTSGERWRLTRAAARLRRRP